MINNTKINGIKSKIKNINIDTFRQSYFIIPYLSTGFTDYTNKGETTNLNNPNDHETFKRVWTGNDAIVINWKNSSEVIFLEEDIKPKIKYQLGEYFMGEVENVESDISIINDKSFSEYKTQESKVEIQMRVSPDFLITPDYEFLFFKIPELKGSQILRIINIESEYIDFKLKNYIIQFETVNQELSNTGRARQQNIMPSAPGQGYLEAIIKDINWPATFAPGEFEKLVDGIDYIFVNDRYLTADFQKTLNRPVKKVVVKLFGAGILSSFTMTGRPVKQGETFEVFNTPRILFPINIKPASTGTLFRTQQASNNYYYGGFSPETKYMKDIMALIKDAFTPLNKWNSQGVIVYKDTDIKATNPKVNGVYDNQLYGKVELSEEGTNVFRKWSPKIAGTLKTLSQGVEPVINLVDKERPIEDYFFFDYWSQKHIKTLPMNISSSVGFGILPNLALGALVTSGFWAAGGLLLVGILGTLVARVILPVFEGFKGIIPCELIEVNEQYQNPDTAESNINMSILQQQSEENPSSIFFDNSTLMTAFEGEITDKFSKGGVIYETNNIGQNKFENGEFIFSNKSYLNINGEESLILDIGDTEGYIIDNFQLQAMFDGEFSVEFLDGDDKVVWTGIYQSEGKWTGSIREIWSQKNTSAFGREQYFFAKPLPYPTEIPPIPTLDIEGEPLIVIINNSATTSLIVLNQSFEARPTLLAEFIDWVETLGWTPNIIVQTITTYQDITNYIDYNLIDITALNSYTNFNFPVQMRTVREWFIDNPTTNFVYKNNDWETFVFPEATFKNRVSSGFQSFDITNRARIQQKVDIEITITPELQLTLISRVSSRYYDLWTFDKGEPTSLEQGTFKPKQSINYSQTTLVSALKIT